MKKHEEHYVKKITKDDFNKQFQNKFNSTKPQSNSDQHLKKVVIGMAVAVILILKDRQTAQQNENFVIIVRNQTILLLYASKTNQKLHLQMMNKTKLSDK